MSEAFNNYCLNCDQLCLLNLVYCLEECRSHDSCEQHVVSPLLSYHRGVELPLPLMGYTLATLNEPVDDFNLYTVSLDSLNNMSSIDFGALAVLDNYRKWLHALH